MNGGDIVSRPTTTSTTTNRTIYAVHTVVYNEDGARMQEASTNTTTERLSACQPASKQASRASLSLSPWRRIARMMNPRTHALSMQTHAVFYTIHT